MFMQIKPIFKSKELYTQSTPYPSYFKFEGSLDQYPRHLYLKLYLYHYVFSAILHLKPQKFMLVFNRAMWDLSSSEMESLYCTSRSTPACLLCFNTCNIEDDIALRMVLLP